MELAFDQINWLAVLACVVAGQVLLTVWFVVIFGDPWAKAYGGPEMTKAQHTKEVPVYTYAIGAACVFLLSVGVSLVQAALSIDDIVGGLTLALFLSGAVFIPMAMPAYAFLRRWTAFVIGAGSQVTLLCVISVIIALWK